MIPIENVMAPVKILSYKVVNQGMKYLDVQITLNSTANIYWMVDLIGSGATKITDVTSNGFFSGNLYGQDYITTPTSNGYTGTFRISGLLIARTYTIYFVAQSPSNLFTDIISFQGTTTTIPTSLTFTVGFKHDSSYDPFVSPVVLQDILNTIANLNSVISASDM